MAVKTIEDLTAHVAFDKANDIIHLWQPAASGEKDRKSTLDDVIGLLNTNTTFSNIPYLDKANTFTQENIFSGIVNVGGNPSPAHPLEVYNGSATADARIASGGNFSANLRLENTVNKWTAQVHAGTGNFRLIDSTATVAVMVVEAAAPANSLYVNASGDIGSGRAPTADFDFYRATDDITLLVNTGKVNGLAVAILKNDAQQWGLGVRGSQGDNFQLLDFTNGSLTPFAVEPGAPTNSIYVNSSGYTGHGVSPLAFFDVNAVSDTIGRIMFSDGVTFATLPGAVSNDPAILLYRWTGSGSDVRGTAIFQQSSDLAFANAPAGTAGSLTWTEQMRLHSSGALLVHTATSLHSALKTIESFGDWAIIGRSSDTNDIRKFFRLGMTHFSNTEEPISLIVGDSDGTDNIINIGGGTGSGNAATIIKLFTAATDTTLTGTERGRLISDGKHLIGLTAVDGTGALLQVAGDLSIRGVSDVDRAMHYASDASINWDESLHSFDTGNIIFARGTRQIDGASISQNNIFDILKFYMTTTGVDLDVKGNVEQGGIGYRIIYAYKTSPTVISLEGINVNTGARATITLTDGSGTLLAEVRLTF